MKPIVLEVRRATLESLAEELKWPIGGCGVVTSLLKKCGHGVPRPQKIPLLPQVAEGPSNRRPEVMSKSVGIVGIRFFWCLVPAKTPKLLHSSDGEEERLSPIVIVFIHFALL